MNGFQITVDSVSKYTSENYYEPLGITRERAIELINHVRDSVITDEGSDQVTVMSYTSKFAKNINELMFIGFKCGEITGFLQAGTDPSIPKQIAVDLMMHKFQSK